MIGRLTRQLVTPTVVFIGVTLVIAFLIVAIGEILLELHPHDAPSELERPELWVALLASLAVIGIGAVLSRPAQGRLGLFDREIALGDRSFFAPEPPPLDERMRRGPAGTIADIREGFTLYARSGPLARVIGILPGEEEYGRRRRGIIYASGLYGASDELWIPVEAILAIYPETGSVFLAAKGDETDHFGWNRPPQSFRRDESGPHRPPSSF